MSIQHSPSQQNKRWTQIVKMRSCVILFSLLIFVISTSALATVSKQLHFEWGYDITLPGLAGYILYQDGQQLLTINNPATLAIDYSVEVVPGQTTLFTMKAFDVNGIESAISAPYSLAVPAEVPVTNILPVPSLNLSFSSGESPLVVDFSAEGSTDSDGTIISYVWDFGDGESATTITTSHMYITAGKYTVTLTVTDNAGGVSTASTIVTVSSVIPTNTPPTALFSSTQTSGTIPLVVGFDGSGSSDNDGTITGYNWNFGDGSSATGANVSHVFTTAGSFTVELTVTDNNGSQATYKGVIIANAATVTPINPVASFTIIPQDSIVKTDVQFSGAASTAPAGNITRYLWEFGDGQQSSIGVTVSHQYKVPGTYTAKLTVWDNNANSSQKSVACTVKSLNKRVAKDNPLIQGALEAIRFLLLKKSEK